MRKRCYLGCDVHEKSRTVCLVWEEAGELRRRDLGVVKTTQEALQAAAAGWAASWGARLGELWPPVPVMEATGRSLLVHDALVPLMDEVWVVDPSEVARLRGNRPKNDKEDAFGLGKLAVQRLLKPLWVPSPEALGLRAMVRTRASAVAHLTSLGNHLRGLAKQGGNPVERGKTLSGANLRRLKAASWKTRDFSAAIEFVIREAEDLTRALRDFEARLQQRFEENEAAQLLATLPRCAVIGSLTLATEIGDIGRFRSAEALRSFAGLTPGYGESAGKRTGGGLNKHGNRHLRCAFMSLANQLQFFKSDEEELAALYWRHFNKRRGLDGAALRAQAVVASRLCDIV